MSDFTLDFLQAINDWQAGAVGKKTEGVYVFGKKNELGDKLKNLIINLPMKFKTYNGVCYRKFNSSDNLKIGLGKYIDEKYSSWTIDYEIAKSDNFLKEYNKKQIGIIVKKNICADDDNVLLNLKSLYEDDDFLIACELYKDKINNFSGGIGKYANSQCEVIMTKTKFSINDIVAYRGKGKKTTEFIQTYFSYDSEKEKQYWYTTIRQKYPNIDNKIWVDDIEVIERLKKFQEIKSKEIDKKPSYISLGREYLSHLKELIIDNHV